MKKYLTGTVMCQRVCIAMAFASNPDLVISDEATTALDSTTQRHVVELMREMQARRGTSVIFVTHDIGLALHACDDIAVLYAGDLVESGPAREVVASPRHPYTRALLRANPLLKGERVRVEPLNGHMSFTGYVRDRRLERCRQELMSPAHRGLSVSEICFRWGFNDAAHFSRSFRAKFDMTPRSCRKESGVSGDV